jgi:hypothetical protein
MRLVTVLLGALAVCLVAFAFSVFGYARHGSAVPASTVAPSPNPTASPATVGVDPGSAAPPQLVAAPPDSAAAGSGPVSIAPPQSEPVAVAPQSAPAQPDPTAAPAGDENPKHHGGGHDKHGGGGGGGD